MALVCWHDTGELKYLTSIELKNLSPLYVTSLPSRPEIKGIKHFTRKQVSKTNKDDNDTFSSFRNTAIVKSNIMLY